MISDLPRADDGGPRATPRAPRRGPEATTLALALLFAACASIGEPDPPHPVTGPGADLVFADATRTIGLEGIRYRADLRRGKIIATMGGGVAWGDVDGDGDPDLFATQGRADGRPGGSRGPCGRLYRNDGGSRFVDVTEAARIEACGWGSGAVFEDVDQDGDLDLFLTFVGANQLWLATGDGTFREAAGELGLAAPGYNSGAAFLDVEGDGDLDLYLTRYVDTSPEEELEWPAFRLRMPEHYPAPPNALLERRDDGRWVDATEAAGVADPEGRGLGVVAADLDLDGFPDLFVANDRSPNALFWNRGDGVFLDATLLAGVGVGADGRWESAMGVAAADVDGNGLPDLLVTNYVDEPNTLFLNQGGLVFSDGTRSSGMVEASWDWVGWAIEVSDLDNDGFADLFVANGHLIPTWIARIGTWLHGDELVASYVKGGYRQPLLLFRGGPGGGFSPVSVGLDLPARGGSLADVDRDGRPDLFVHSLGGGEPARLLVNRTPDPGFWLDLELRAPGRTPSPLGARLRIGTAAGDRHLQVASGGSYLSSSAVPLHVGLGRARKADVEILFRGRRVIYRELPANRVVAVGLPVPRSVTP